MANLGKDSYLQVEMEGTYGTAATGSETQMPILPGTDFENLPELIETEDLMADRTKKAEQIGSYMRPFQIVMYLHPSRIGFFLECLFGDSSDADNGDGTYTHTWLSPISDVRIAKSFTSHFCKGGELADQNDGCIVTGFNLTVDVKGNFVWTLKGYSQGFTTDVARETTFSYPSEIPLNFSMCDFQYATASKSIRNLSLDFDLGYNVEDDYFMNSQEISQLQFSDRPSLTGSFGLDASHTYLDDALAQTSRAIDIAITSTENAGGTTKWQLDFEIPAAKMLPDTTMPIVQDRMKMDVGFDGSYGGTTTGSGSNSVALEVRLTDTTAAYS